MAGLLNSLFSLRLSNVLTTVPSRSHRGYLPFEGRLPNIESEEKQLKLQTKAINLKPVKRIHFKVDPLHHRARSIRQVNCGIGAKTDLLNYDTLQFRITVYVPRNKRVCRVKHRTFWVCIT